MSKRNGRYYAAFGVAALLLLGAAPSPNPPAVENAKGAIQGNEEPEARQKQGAPPPAPKDSQSAPEPSSPPANPRAGEHDAEGPIWTDKVVAVTAILVALFTAVLTWVGVEQALLLRRSVRESAGALEVAKESAHAATSAAASTALLAETAARQADVIEASSRAWMFFSDAREGRYGDNDIYEIHWENAGNVTAVITGVALACLPAEEPPDPADAPMLELPAGAIVGAGGRWRRGVIFKRDFADAWERADHIYLFGRIHYRDATSKERKTWFCRLYTGKQFVLDDITDWSRNGYD